MKLRNLVQFVGISVFALMTANVAFAAKELKFAHVYETTHPLHKGAEAAAKRIAKATDGRVVIKVFPASSLGKEVEINEGLAIGTLDFIYTGVGFAGTTYGPMSMTDYPFTLRDLDHWRAYRDSSLFKEIAAGYKKATGGAVDVIAISYYGSRHVTANKPILTPKDMVGLKIRVPNAPAYLLFPKAVKANPTPMAFSEVYLALQQGVVDAQENPLTTIQAKKFHEVQSNINLTGHIANTTLMLASSNVLKKLSAKDRAVVIGELKDTADWVTKEVADAEAKLADWFRGEGITVNVVDRGPFIEAVRPALTTGDLPFSADLYSRLQKLGK